MSPWDVSKASFKPLFGGLALGSTGMRGFSVDILRGFSLRLEVYSAMNGFWKP